MLSYTVLMVIGLVLIALILALRFTTHFHFCRRVSRKYPGEKIKGCPSWTIEEKSGETGLDEK